MKLKRFGVSMAEDLLKDFDEINKRKGYKTRSESIRDLVRNLIVQEKWSTASKDSIGVISLVYNHHIRELDRKLNEIQHKQHANVMSSLHIHLDYHNCLEVIIVKGKSKDINKIADNLINVKGVKHGTLSITNAKI